MVTLGLTISAAVLSVLATQAASLSSAFGKALALSAAAAVSLAQVTRTQVARGSLVEWTRLRSVSEALKSELFTFLTETAQYRRADRDRQLERRARGILSDADDLLRFTAGLRPAERALPAVHDVESYVVVRLDPQRRWYTDRAAKLQTRLNRVRFSLLTLTGLGVVLAAIAVTLDVGGATAWVPVVTTVSAAVTAYAAGSRYEYQLVEYLRTAAQLDHLRSEWAAGRRDSTAVDAFVADCEQVISVQNEAWMAKWAGDGEDTATTGQE